MEFSLQIKPTDSGQHLISSNQVIGVIDKDTTITYLDPKDPSSILQNSQSFNSPITYPHTKSNASSDDGKYLSLYLDTKKRTYLCVYSELERKYKPKVVLSWSIGVTEVSCFSPDNKMLAVGGADGLLTIYSTTNGKVINSLPRQNEFITAIGFSKNSKLIGYASFKKILVIYDLTSNLPLKVTSYDDVISIIGFLNQRNFLIYGARDNQIVLFDILNGRTIRELGATISWPVSIYVDKNDQYALISDKAGYVHIVDLLRDDAELEPFYNSPNIVVEIKILNDEFLFFLFEDGSLRIVNLKEALEKIAQKKEEEDIEHIYKIIATNPLLRFGVKEILEKNDAQYLKKIDHAMESLVAYGEDAARTAMGKTIDSPANKERFETLLKHKDKVIHFWQAVKQGDFTKAYDMAEDGTFYKKLSFYEKLEKHYHKTFQKALKIMISTRNIIDVQNYMAAFMKTPSKSRAIKAMMDEPEKFAEVEKAFHDCEFLKVGQLFDEYKLLQHSPVFTEYNNFLEENQRNFSIYMTEGNYTKAIETMEFIQKNFPNEVKKHTEDFHRLEIVKEFNETIINKEFSKAMDLASAHTFLIAAKEYKALDTLVSTRIQLAVKYAFGKKFIPMDKLLRPFLKSKYSRNRAIGIYKIFYIEQIQEFSQKMSDKHWEHTIESYVKRFGFDQEIDRIAKKYDKDKILEQFEEYQDHSFLRYKAVTNIITGPIVLSNIKPSKKPN